MSSVEFIPIAVATVVNSVNDINVNEEIDQSISSTITEIDRKNAEIRSVNEEARAIQNIIESMFGAAFMRRQLDYLTRFSLFSKKIISEYYKFFILKIKNKKRFDLFVSVDCVE